MSPEFPSYPVPVNSPFYIERPPIEENAYREIEKPGSLIRLKAPRKMGKSSLLIRILSHVKTQGYKTINVDFQEADEAIYGNLYLFLRWFCAKIARGLKLQPLLDEYWDEDMGSKVSCTTYLETYILEELDSPIVIALNEVNLVFEHTAIAKDFLPLLRFWHEQARQNEAFEKLRLIVVHSTEIYVPLNLNQSPFNVGFPIELPPFNLAQIRELAARYELHWSTETEALELLKMSGGHPYLIRLALYHLARGQVTLEDLLKNAPTQEGIYQDHLINYWNTIQEEPQLIPVLKELSNSQEGMQLEPIIAYKLNSMGLVIMKGDHCHISCELYRQYFARHAPEDSNLKEETQIKIKQLAKENQILQELVHIDSLTNIANRRYFDSYLEQEWRRCARDGVVISLILLDIDYFKLYNDSYGHQKGDFCLQQVAYAIKSCLQRPADLAARYGGEEFAVILPQTNDLGALNIAKKIQEKMTQLQLEHIDTQLPTKIVTLSIGIATIIPKASYHSSYELGIFIRAADKALYSSKNKGRNQISISKLL